MSVQDGQQLATAAYGTAAITPVGLGPSINGLIYFFSVLSTVIVGLRAWVRFGTEQRWGWDDILAVGGYVAFIASNAFGVLSTHYGLGAPDDRVTTLLEIRSIEYFMYYEIIYFAASSVTKISITLTVLRLCDKQPRLRWISIGNVIMMMTAAGVAGVFVLTNCRPFAVYWNPSLGVCTFGSRGLASLEVVSLVGSTFQMISDWVSALLPFFIISKLQMPRRTKVALVCILGLGIMASVASFVRMFFYKFWDKQDGGYLYYTGVIVLVSELEVGLGIIACSLPPLRRLLKNTFLFFRSRSGQSSSGLPYASGVGGTQLKPLSSSQALSYNRMDSSKQNKWSRLDDDNRSVAGQSKSSIAPIILSETTVTVESNSVEPGASKAPNYAPWAV